MFQLGPTSDALDLGHEFIEMRKLNKSQNFDKYQNNSKINVDITHNFTKIKNDHE